MARKKRKEIQHGKLRRRALWQADPRCHWCGRQTLLPGTPGLKAAAGITATLDHLYSRFHPERSRDNTMVLSCAPCNAGRARRENLVFRDVVWTLDVLGWRALSNRQKVAAFAAALSLDEGWRSAHLPADAGGQALALVYIKMQQAGASPTGASPTRGRDTHSVTRSIAP